MSRYTPGPWQFMERDGFLQVIAAPNAEHWCKSVVLFDPVIGQLVSGVPVNEMRANAHLIALAPDMAEALRNIVRPIPYGEPGHVDFNDALKAARAILAKLED